jgi:hypothetical protein
MARLSFSPEVLRSIRNFGADLTSPAARAGGMLTGAPQQNLSNIFARNVGTLLGRDMRTPQERIGAVVSEQGVSSPEAIDAVIQELARTDPARAVELANTIKVRRDKLADDRAREVKEAAQNQSYLSILEIAQEDGELDLERVVEIAREADLDYSKVNELIQRETTQRQGTRSITKVGTMNAVSPEGNILGQYNVSSIYDPQAGGDPRNANVPIGNAPAFDTLPPGTKIEFISTTTGLSGFQANDLKQANALLNTRLKNFEEEFKTSFDVAKESTEKYLAASEGLTIANRMLDTLGSIETGGSFRAAIKIMGDTFATTPANVGQFVVDAKGLMIQKLRAFGGNPTEGERRAAEELVARIENTKGLNQAIITSYKQEMERRVAINEYRSKTISDPDFPGGRRYPRPEEVIEYMKQVYQGTGLVGDPNPKFTFGAPS